MNDDDTRRIELTVEGMTCGGCEQRVARALRAVSGVHAVEVDVPGQRAVVDIDPSAPLEGLMEAVRRAGYRSRALRTLPSTETGAVTA